MKIQITLDDGTVKNFVEEVVTDVVETTEAPEVVTPEAEVTPVE
jgi:hypothetical protein